MLYIHIFYKICFDYILYFEYIFVFSLKGIVVSVYRRSGG